MTNVNSQSFDETIIYTYLSASATIQQEQELYNWLKDSEQNQATFAEIKAVWHTSRPTSPLSPNGNLRFSRSLNKLNRKIDALPVRTGRVARRNLWWRIASSAAVIAVAFISIYTYRHIASTNQMYYVNNDTTAMHVVMSDGTNIWLGARTKLTYDNSFNKEYRSVKLSGEAYFDVKHDSLRPFIVQTPAFKVKVLGTMFSVRAYENEQLAETTLAEGSVSMQNVDGSNMIRLKPGQQAVYSIDNHELTINKVNIGNILLVKYGLITMSEATLADIVSKLEDTYGVRLKVYTKHRLDKRYDFNFLRSSTINEVVDVLQFVADCQLEIITTK